MKAQFLKISGHKNEKDFYNEFPTQEAFMAKHGATLRKAQNSAVLPGRQLPDPNVIRGYANPFGGMTAQTTTTIAPVFPGTMFKTPGIPTAEYAQQTQTQDMRSINSGVNPPAPTAKKPFDFGSMLTKGIGAATSIIDAVKGIGAEKKELAEARKWRKVSDLTLQASQMADIDDPRMRAATQKKFRDAQNPHIMGDTLGPVYGTGTNAITKNGGKLPTGGLSRGEDYGSKGHPYPSVSKGDFAGGGRSYPIPTKEDAGDALRLASLHHRPDVKAKVYAKYPELRKGQNGEIMNTFAPGTIYDDLEESDPGFTFIPPSDEDIVKAFRSGGLIPRAQQGIDYSGFTGGGKGFPIQGFANAATSVAGNAFGNSQGSQLGGAIGNLGSFTGIPGVGEALGLVGTVAGGIFDKNPQRTERENNKMMQNVQKSFGMDNLKDYYGQHSGSFEHGGNLNPQVITHFNGINMEDIFRKDPTMNTLRSGGNLKTNKVGELEIDEDGILNPISYNPHTAGTGMTSMIEGPSHDDGGTVLKYAEGGQMDAPMVETEGGEPVSERIDPKTGQKSAVVTGNQTFNKLGASMYPNLKEYENKKLKAIHKIKALEDRKLNDFEKKNSLALQEFETENQIDKLHRNSLMWNQKGIELSYKKNAKDVNDLLAFQEANNTTAQEMGGLDAGELSRGKIKYLPIEEAQALSRNGSILAKARNGGILAKAQNGIYKEMEETMSHTPKPMFGGNKANTKIVPKYKRAKEQAKLAEMKRKEAEEAKQKAVQARKEAEQAKRKADAERAKERAEAIAEAKAEAKEKAEAPKGRQSLFGKRVPSDDNKPIPKFKRPKEAAKLAEIKRKQAAEDAKIKQAEDAKKKLAATAAAKSNALAESKRKANASSTAAATSNTAAANESTVSTSPVGNSGRFGGRDVTPSGGGRGTVAPATGGGGAPASAAEVAAKKLVNNAPTPAAQQEALDNYISEFGLTAWAGNKYGLKEKTKSSFSTREWDQIARDMGFSGKGNKEFQHFLINNPESKKLILARHKEIYGRTPVEDDKLFDDLLGYGWAAEGLKGLRKKTETTAPTEAAKENNFDVTPYQKSSWETLAGQILPWMKKTPFDGLRGNQLAGEMFASMDKEEPVQANFYHPQLKTPYDISYQDRLNANQADFNQISKQVGNNPEALAALAAQKYGANSSVLADQFRANQAMKEQVYSGNIDTLNKAQEANLGIADTQYVRQEQAKSNTKEIKKAALDSIASKIGQNRYENMQYQVGMNEVPDFAYGPGNRLLHTGAPASYNIPQMYGPDGKPINGVPMYDSKGVVIGMQQLPVAQQEPTPIAPQPTVPAQTKAARNGNIVRAFKNL